MLRDKARNLRKLMRGAIIAFALFAVLFSPLLLYAWGDNDILDPSVTDPANGMGALAHDEDEDVLEISPPFIRNWHSALLSPDPLIRREQGLDIRGSVPVVANAFDNSQAINEHITDEIITPLIAEARRLRARAISFSFEYKPTEKIISVVIYADISSMLPHTLVRSVNFCASDGRILSIDGAMNEVMGVQITSLAARILSEKIRSNPEHYYAALNALAAPLASQAFYLTDESLVILFDGFRLSTRVGDVNSIELEFANIRWVVLSPEDYRTDGPYGLKMIPMRAMLVEHLGYSIRSESDGEYRRVVWIYDNGTLLIELREGDNEYIVLGTQRRSLEAAPLNFYGRMYVPITFFDRILPLTTYTFGADGRITFVAYRGG